MLFCCCFDSLRWSHLPSDADGLPTSQTSPVSLVLSCELERAMDDKGRGLRLVAEEFGWIC